MNREQIIREYEVFVDGYECYCASDDVEYEMHKAVLALLKEDCHNCKLECLLSKYDELKEKYDTLLKNKQYASGKQRLIDFITGLTPDDLVCGHHISATFGEDGNTLIINFNDREEDDN